MKIFYFFASDTISSKTKSIETICHINRNLMTTNRTNTIDKILNRKLQPTKVSFKFNHTTDENNCILSNDTSFTNNLREKESSDNEISSSEERSFTKFEQNSSNENDFQTSSSTTSGRTSSSISSVENENTIIIPELNRDCQNNCHLSTIKTHIINSNIDSTKKSQQFGIFSRIFGTKSSQNLLITTHQNSKTCVIM